MKANTKVKIDNMDVTPFSEVEGGPTLRDGRFKQTYKGDIEGTSILHELWIFHSDKFATVNGVERITGTVTGKKGSFVVLHEGKLADGILTKKLTILKNSGTGELKGIEGEADVHTGPVEEVPITYEITFK